MKIYRYIVLITLIIQSSFVVSQSLQFKNIGIKEGLKDPYIYTINQDKNGFILIGTGEGIFMYDGFEFINNNIFDSVSGKIIKASAEDSGGNIWFGTDDGLLYSYNGKEFKDFKLPASLNSTITCLTQYDDGILGVSQNNGAFIVSQAGQSTVFDKPFEGKAVSCVYATKENIIMAGTSEGLFIYHLKNNNLSLANRINELEFNYISSISNSNIPDSYYIGTYDAGLFLLTLQKSGGYSITRKENIPEEINSLYSDIEKKLWVCSKNNGVYMIPDITAETKPEKLTIENGLPGNYVRCAFRDKEGNMWFGTYGNGISMLASYAFGFYNSAPVFSLCAIGNDIWKGCNNALQKHNLKNNSIQEYNMSNGIPKDKITSIYRYSDNILFLGTSENGCLRFDTKSGKATTFHFQGSNTNKSINYITGTKNTIYIATKNGIYISDLNNNTTKHFTTDNGLPHNYINHIYIDNEGTAWISTKSNSIYTINSNFEIKKAYSLGTYEMQIISILIDKSKNVWAITYGDGIFYISGNKVSTINTDNGLKSNYCYSITCDTLDNIWVGHRAGISRINKRNETIKLFTSEQGFYADCNINSIEKNRDGKIIIGTTEGITTYDFREDNIITSPPILNITSLTLNNNLYDVSNKSITLPYSIYKLKAEYIGLNYNSPEDIYYEYKLQGKGFDTGFSEPSTLRTIIYPNIRDGDYVLTIKASNYNFTEKPSSYTIHIKVKPPFWKKPFFIILSFIFCIIVVFLIIIIRERKQKAFQRHLEDLLQERTYEVIEQKDIIEAKNRDITASINYAKRIQTSILPTHEELQKLLSGVFVFFAPRDIVSGDFYWFDKVNDDKFIVICADSTGHGVPGAFMSMIGITLIKDIIYRTDVNSPADILSRLNDGLIEVLNQNTVGGERSNDGMDVVALEINVKTNYIRFASAMRPVVIYKNGKELYVKGSRSSIGGNIERTIKRDKEYMLHEMQLEKGDSIYMFSDGYPDQFGGGNDKKYKISRLRETFNKTHSMNIDEQYQYISEDFYTWRGKEDQIDDVLLMGIKL